MFEGLISKKVRVLTPCIVISRSDEFLYTKFSIITEDGQVDGVADSFDDAVTLGKAKAKELGIEF